MESLADAYARRDRNLREFIEQAEFEESTEMELFITNHGDSVSITDEEQSIVLDSQY